MKKFAFGLVICVLLFFSGSAKADTFVNYNWTGHPVSISRGAGPAIPYATYQSRVRSGYYQGMHNPRYNHRRRHRNFYGNMNPHLGEPQGNVMAQSKEPELSRFDKNYTPRRQTSYTVDGITYYN